MLHQHPRLQSWHAGIRREAGRTGTLRNHDGRASRPPRRHHGYHHRRHGPGGPARRLLPEPALARQAGHGYSTHHEELDRRERTDPERDGGAEEEGLSGMTTEGTPYTGGTTTSDFSVVDPPRSRVKVLQSPLPRRVMAPARKTFR